MTLIRKDPKTNVDLTGPSVDFNVIRDCGLAQFAIQTAIGNLHVFQREEIKGLFADSDGQVDCYIQDLIDSGHLREED